MFLSSRAGSDNKASPAALDFSAESLSTKSSSCAYNGHNYPKNIKSLTGKKATKKFNKLNNPEILKQTRMNDFKSGTTIDR